MSRAYGNWSIGFLWAQSPRRALTMPHIVCSALTDSASFPSTLTCVSATAFPGLN